MRFLRSHIVSPPRPLVRLLLLIVLFCWLPVLSMAVDRSKFRTCEQTSFCRRHRNQHSARLYKYKLVDVQLYQEEDLAAQDVEERVQAELEKDKKENVWKKLQRHLMGGDEKDAGDTTPGKDPFVQGPPATLTGRLVNTAATSDKEDDLQWSVTALSDGLLRMRITETYGAPGSPHEQARVTYDELVLNDADQWKAAAVAALISPDSDEQGILKRLVDKKDSIQNYMALQYSDSDSADATSGMILLIRLEPFSLYLYRHDSLDDGPILTLGEKEMTHFEVRRFATDEDHANSIVKNSNGNGNSDQLGPVDDDDEAEAETKEKAKDKEIVGYWEDGLAIYADGTREEKHEVEQDHRQLTEAELDREGLWEESFGDHKDSKPYGPMSVGMDISFAKSDHLFGLPEHASSTRLQTTLGDGAHYKEPYRLYNLDVFEYELDETMALYGAVPLIVSQSAATGTSGVLWFNPTETFVDVLPQETEDKSNESTTHWMSESGVIDVFLLPGPTPKSLYRQYATLTGVSPVPPMFSLGYHQCRWNYKDEKDVLYVHGMFEKLDYPYDVLWLDIEHTDDKRYFTWDQNLFPTPNEMLDTLWAQGRRMVTIIDPHIKRDDNYYIHKEATAKRLYVKDKDGQKDYDGWCWPGSSSYLDFTSDKVRSWWADQFSYSRYVGSGPSLFTWNDMNEPSVFNGPEVSMQKDLKNLRGDEHREWHNLYGMLFHRATTEGQIRRNQPDENVRPFVLSRSFFAGSQRYGAIWTGDNGAEWSHLEVAAPMLLGLNVAALSFVGADVGGFFGNPDAELFTRWYQAGAYQPFFRGHAHHDSKRREPWMFDDDTLVRLRRAAMARYALLPYWYTVFQEAEMTGMPVMRTMWMQYPETEALFAIDDQYMIGSDLLVKPVTGAGVTESEVLFPTDDTWYDAESLSVVSPAKGSKAVTPKTVPSDIDFIPVYQRGGSVIPRKLRLRRSSELMKRDPYTLYVALDGSNKAQGRLYMDDEESFGYQRNAELAQANVSADLSSGSAWIRNSVSIGHGWTSVVNDMARDRMVERIVIMGVEAAPKVVSVDDESIDFNHVKASKLVVIRKPEVSMLNDWTIQVTF